MNTLLVLSLVDRLFSFGDRVVTKLMQRQEETKKQAREAAIASIPAARGLETELGKCSTLDDPPRNPRPGQRWLDPHSNTVMSWNPVSSTWNPAAPQVGDFFGDAAW